MHPSTVFKLLYWLWIATELLVVSRTRTPRSSGEVQDRGSLIVLWVVIFASMSVGTWAGAAYAPASIHEVRLLWIVTLMLMTLGLLIRWTAIFTLGKSFSANVAIHATQKLKRSGLFRYMRHPSYTGMVLLFLGMGLSTHNWMGLAIIFVPPMAALLYRIHVEEAALTGAFGREYVEYSRTTKRLIPGVY